MSNYIALIVAAGIGERFDTSLPKQYFKLENGNCVLRQTIEKFLVHPKITDVCVVIHENHYNLYKGATKGLELLPHVFGKETRQKSVHQGLLALASYNPDYVLIHDGCRPFLSSKLIDLILNALESCDAVDVGLAIHESIRKHQQLEIALNRKDFYISQTPHSFKYQRILEAHHQALKDNKVYRDDIELAIDYGMQITLVAGEKRNIKITNSEDIQSISKSPNKIGYGYDIHAFDVNNRHDQTIILGGIAIEHHYAILAHSDGDVVLHAVVDAILGALGIGDIGDYFPNTDERWKNCASTVFLKKAAELATKMEYYIGNIDITIVCQSPKIFPFKEQMRAYIATVLQISAKNINIKATTKEGLGAVGRGLGIEVYAIALLQTPLPFPNCGLSINNGVV